MSLGISDAIAFYGLIRQVYRGRRIVGALFDWEGKRIDGSEKLKVKRISGFNDVWWYSVEPLNDYQFVRIPVNPGVVMEAIDYKDSGTRVFPKPSDNPEVRCFRYVPAYWPQQATAAQDIKYLPNAKVSFMVFAYKPSDLMSMSKQ